MKIAFIPRSADLLYIDDLAEFAQMIIKHAALVHDAGSDGEVTAHIEVIERQIRFMQRTLEMLKPPPAPNPPNGR